MVAVRVQPVKRTDGRVAGRKGEVRVLGGEAVRGSLARIREGLSITYRNPFLRAFAGSRASTTSSINGS